MSILNAITAGAGGVALTGDTSGNLTIQSAGTNVAIFATGGNVGIGTTSPASVLDVKAGSGSVISRSTSGTNFKAFYDDGRTTYTSVNYDGLSSVGAQDLIITAGSGASQVMQFRTSDTERMRILSNGAVAIGNAGSYSGIKLSITGTDTSGSSTSLRVEDNTTNNMFSVNNNGLITTGTRAASPYNNTTGSSANMVVDSSGNIGRSTSAAKYKTNVRDLPSVDISKFRPVVYNSLCSADDKTKDYFGFIADEVDAAGIKELVTYGAEGEVEGFQYERMTVVLVKAIQELSATVSAQAAQIAALQAKVGA
jgi:hypothetical protein